MKNTTQRRWLLSLLLPVVALGCGQSSLTDRGDDAENRLAQLDVNHALATPGEAEVSLVANEWGTLKGKFVLDGKAPAAAKLKITKDQAFCGPFGLTSEDLVVSDDGGIRDIFIWVRVKRSTKLKIHPDYDSDADATIRITNKDCRYEPHSLVLRAGQKLELGNDDKVAHNVNLPFTKNQPYNRIIPPSGTDTIKKLSKAERLPVEAKCDIHPWMNGRVLVQTHPYAAVTGEDGSFEIKNLPAGSELEFQVWHVSGYVDTPKVGGKPWKKGRFKMKVAKGDNDLGEIKLKAKDLQ